MCDPHRQATCNHTGEGSHATYSQKVLRYITMYTQDKREYDNQMNNDTNIMLKDDRVNMRASESTCQIKLYTMVNLYNM